VYLIDTDILIFFLRGHPAVREAMEEHVADPKWISVITYGELLYGAERSARPVVNAARVRRVAELLPVIDLTPAVMETYAPLKGRLEKKGTRCQDYDLLIAATALVTGAVLVTNNRKHFDRIPGLAVQNWI